MSSTTAGCTMQGRPSSRRTRLAEPRWRTRASSSSPFQATNCTRGRKWTRSPMRWRNGWERDVAPERTIGNSSRSDYDLSCLAPRDRKCWAQNGTHDNNRTLKARSPDAPSAKGLVAFRNEAEATRQLPPKLPWEAICAHEASILPARTSRFPYIWSIRTSSSCFLWMSSLA